MIIMSDPAPSPRARLASSLLLSQPRTVTRTGRVIHGNKLGRQLGIPTANIALRDEQELRFGVYATIVEHDGRVLAGAASWGTRPHFDDGAPLLEVHLLDFRGDLYDLELTVDFISFIRAERAFPSVEAMMREIERDIARTRQLTAHRLNAHQDAARRARFGPASCSEIGPGMLLEGGISA